MESTEAALVALLVELYKASLEELYKAELLIGSQAALLMVWHS